MQSHQSRNEKQSTWWLMLRAIETVRAALLRSSTCQSIDQRSQSMAPTLLLECGRNGCRSGFRRR